MNEIAEKIIEKFLIMIAFSTVAVLFLITFFIFKEGIPFLAEYGLFDFLSGTIWLPGENNYGILPMIAGSICVTIGALVVGVPLGVGTAIFLVEFTNKRVRNIVKPMIELLAGIPSVVYGFIGIMVLAPWVRVHLGGSGLSIFTASIVLGIMILPTVISITMDSLSALSPAYKEGSIALGATNWQTVVMVLLPGAKSGILAGIILGMGRAIGETMAVIMITGNAIRIPTSLYDSVRTMTSNIALEMGYALGIHRSALFANAVVLFGFIMILNTIAILIINKRSK